VHPVQSSAPSGHITTAPRSSRDYCRNDSDDGSGYRSSCSDDNGKRSGVPRAASNFSRLDHRRTGNAEHHNRQD
jgi:hypothetical protein